MTTATITADIDNFLDATDPNVNHGGLTTMECMNTWSLGEKLFLNRSLGNFDLSSIPAGATVDSAKLVQNITTIQNGNRASTVHRCTRPSTWTENGSSWNNYKVSTAWTDKGGDFTDTDKVTFTFPAATGEFAITGMKTLVEDAIANRSDILSVILKFDLETEESGNDRYIWGSSEFATEAERWRLVVEYTGAGVLPERKYPRGAARGVKRGATA